MKESIVLSDNGGTDWFIVRGAGGVTISGKGTIGGGTVSLQQVFDSDISSPDVWKNDSDTDITFSAEFDRHIPALTEGAIFNLELTGATTPTFRLSIAGNVERFKPHA